jgi:diguanylate cyclase (GGDEF)-like protein/PAS domain S-box-containing protein
LIRRAYVSMSSVVSLIDIRKDHQPLVYVSPGFERLTGYTEAEAIGRSWTLSEGSETDREAAATLQTAVAHGRETRVQIRHHRRDGTAYWSELLMMPCHDRRGRLTHYMSVQKNVTAKAEAIQRAAHMAYHDDLTGLPNRAQLQEHLALALARAQRHAASFGLVFFDLDGFKEVNDRYGHDAGDRLLQDVGRRWRSIARDGDVLARYGGDEFVLLITTAPGEPTPAIAEIAAARYADALTIPFDALEMPEQPIKIEVSAGIAVYPDDATTPEALLLAADAAMYTSKRTRKARVRVN